MDNTTPATETPFEVTRIWPHDPVAVQPGSLPDLQDIVETTQVPDITPKKPETVQVGPFRVMKGEASAPAPAALSNPDAFTAEGMNINYRGDPNAMYGRAATAKAVPFAGIVVHHTAIDDTEKSIQYGLTNDAARGGSFGYHFYIGKDGSVHQGAPLSVRTNHVKDPGAAERTSGLSLNNSNAIGISMVGMGNDHTPEQISAATKLAKALQQKYGISVSNIFGHGELQSDRQSTEGMPVVKALRGDTAPVVSRSLVGRLTPELESVIPKVSQQYGLDPEYLRAQALIESNGGRNMGPSSAGARGAFQFMPATWQQYGNGANVDNLEANADAAARLAIANKQQLSKALGVTPTNADLYLAHQQGATGAVNLLTNPKALAKDIVGLDAVQGNLPRNLRGNAPTITAAQFADYVRSKYDQVAGSGPSTGVSRDAASPPSVIDFSAPPPAPPGAQWTAAQAEALRLANREDRAGFFDGLSSGFKDNLTGRLINATTQSVYNPDPNFRINLKEMTDGIAPQYHDYFSSAVSQAHANQIRSDVLARQEVDRVLTRDHGFAAGAGSIIGALADPSALLIGLATAGVGSMIAEGANLGVAGTRLVQAGAGAVGNIATDMMVPNEPMTPGHLVMSGLLGAGFGAALGPIGKNAALISETAALERLAVRQANAVKQEMMTSVSPGAIEGATATRAISDNLATVAEDVAAKGYSWLRWSEGGKAAASDNALTRVLGGILGVDTVGKGALTNVQSADQIAERVTRRELGEWRSTLKPQFTEWNAARGSGAFSGMSPTKWQEFNELVTEFVRSKSPNKANEFEPQVVKAGQTMEKILGEKAKDFQNPLRGAGLEGRAMAFLDLNSTYVPRVWSPVKMNLALESHGIDNVRTTIMGGLLRSTPDMDEAVAKRIADHIINTRALGYNENLNNFLHAKDLNTLKEYLETQVGLSKAEVESLGGLLAKKAPGEGADPSLSNLKRRLGIDEGYEHDFGGGKVLKMTDLFENNADALMNDYLRRANGRIALAGRRVHDPVTGEVLLDGVQNDAEWKSLLKMAEDRGIAQGMDRQTVNKELEGLQWMYDRLMGRPDPAVFGETAQWLRLLRTFNFSRLMGQMGFAQMTDLGNVIGNVGLKAFLQHSRGFAREFTDGRLILKHGLDRELEAMFGVGTDSLRAFRAMNLEGEIHMRAMPTPGRRQKFLQSAQSAADVAAEFTTTVSGMHAVNSWQQLVFGRAAAQKFADMAADGTTTKSAERLLRYLGIEPQMEKRIMASVQKEFTYEDGALFGRKVAQMNLDKWADQEASAVFQNALYRWSKHTVQENDIGGMSRFMSRPMMQTMLQFRSFIATAWENQTMHHAIGVANGDMRSFATMAWATITGALVYAAQTHLQALGRSDHDAFLVSKGLGAQYDWAKLGPAIVQRSGWSSVIPMFADTGFNLAGFEGYFNASHSQRASNSLFNNPTASLLNDIQRATTGTRKSLQDGRELTQDEARAWFRLAPWHTAMPFVQLSSTLIGNRAEPTVKNN